MRSRRWSASPPPPSRCRASAEPLPLPKRPRAVPADVLRRRPDVAESERLTAAANYGVGVARANFFPEIHPDRARRDAGHGLQAVQPGQTCWEPSVRRSTFRCSTRGCARPNSTSPRQSSLRPRRIYRVDRSARRQGGAGRPAARALARRRNSDKPRPPRRRPGEAAELSLTLYRDGASSFLDVVTAQSAALEAERLSNRAAHARTGVRYRPDAGPRRRMDGRPLAAASTGRPDACARATGQRSFEGAAMTDESTRPANCGACAFWRKLRDNDGVCCRHAPRGRRIHPEQVAHWPQTHRQQWCGEGVVPRRRSRSGRTARIASIWRRPGTGAPSGQSGRHADGVVGVRRDLRPPRAAPRSEPGPARSGARPWIRIFAPKACRVDATKLPKRGDEPPDDQARSTRVHRRNLRAGEI